MVKLVAFKRGLRRRASIEKTSRGPSGEEPRPRAIATAAIASREQRARLFGRLLEITSLLRTAVARGLQDYQGNAHGGDVDLRLFTFRGDHIEVRTYSPWLDRFRTDDRDRFELPRLR